MAPQTPIDLAEYKQKIKDQLDYGDSIASWVRDACKLRLNLENSEEILEDMESIDETEAVDVDE